MDVLIATTNPNKLREIRSILADAPVRLHGLAELPAVAEPDETGTDFITNARMKAHAYAHVLANATVPWAAGALVVAEDSGLEIDALDGEPGVRSARFLREDASYEERFAEIYRRLAVHPEHARTARFVCALVALRQREEVFATIATVEGTIAPEPAGSGGFGYDPIFLVPQYGQTLAQVSAEQKAQVAHRGQAFRRFGEWLRRT